MQESPPGRPFGLMLLIGLSFGIAVWNLMAAAQIFIAQRMKGDLPANPGIDVAVLHSLWALPVWAIFFLVGVGLLKAALLFVAAWGYFNFKRLAGRYVGSAYGVVSLAESVLVVAALGYPVTGASVIGVLFAVFTLLAVNGPYKPLLSR